MTPSNSRIKHRLTVGENTAALPGKISAAATPKTFLGFLLLAFASCNPDAGSATIDQNQPIELANFPYCIPTPSTQGHPNPQFRMPEDQFYQETIGTTTYVRTLETCLPEPELSPFTLPPGTNLLPNVYTNMFDGSGNEMVNTLPSTPNIPYNLHDGDPVVEPIDVTSPSDDMRDLVFELAELLATEEPNINAANELISFGIDILEGNPIPDRAYSGFPLLHYNGPEKAKRVDGETKTVVVHQIWYDEHIESDTSFIDPVK